MKSLTQSLKEVKGNFREVRNLTLRDLIVHFAKLCIKFFLGIGALPATAQPASPLLPLPAQTSWGRAALPLKGPLSLVLETDLDPRVAAAAKQLIRTLPNGTAAAAAGPTLQIRYGRLGQAEKLVPRPRYHHSLAPQRLRQDERLQVSAPSNQPTRSH